ncbi:MAG TPA: phosphoribosylformylglycinamidine synthase subunit PurL [Planctomycetota bacterium]|nr:phosphoribosylformylglycinamidine synthase subunit PurL [Planctomycetota bacterium]
MAHHRIEVSLWPELGDPVGMQIVGELTALGIRATGTVRLVKVYHLYGDLTIAEASTIARELLADQITETFTVDTPIEPLYKTGFRPVEIVLKPGVMEPTRESLLKALADLGYSKVTDVRTGRRYLFSLGISEPVAQLAAEKILANGVIEDIVFNGRMDADPPKPAQAKFELKSIGLRDLSNQALETLSIVGCLSLTLEEMLAIQAHYRKIQRDPTDVELETIAQTWSEHCVHKTLKGIVNYDGRRIDNLLKQTIARATREINADWCLSVFVDNAGVIKFDDTDAICFKVETHNHPSAIEPYGGAGTGVGGVIRDILGTGCGARPIANTDVFCVGPLDLPLDDLPPGALHPRRVLHGVVAGVRDYGNRMGIPTVNGGVYSDPRYIGNPLVFCGTLGIIPNDKIAKTVEPGDRVVVIGGRTGRDGIHGATFSSIELTDQSEMLHGTAVQIGNPIMEKKMTDVLLQARDKGLYRSVTDCGAGGLSSAVGEMGSTCGVDVVLEKVPLKYAGLSYTEIWISEAQERLVLAVPPKNRDALLKLCASEGVEATDIGEFTATGKLVLHYNGTQVGELDNHFLHEGLPRREQPATWQAPTLAEKMPAPPADIKQWRNLLRDIFKSPNIASKEWIIRQYDHEVQGGTVVKPLCGLRAQGPADGTVVLPKLDGLRGVGLGLGFNPHYSDIDPAAMAESAVDEAVRNVIAVGAPYGKIAILDNFCWGNCRKPDRLGALVRAAEAATEAALAFRTPFISGKDSLNNEFRHGEETICIPHTLLISALAVIPDVRKCTTMDLKAAGNKLYQVGLTRDELGGSHYFAVAGGSSAQVPRLNRKLAPQVMQAMAAAIDAQLCESVHDLSEGGLAVAAAEMAFSGDLGAHLNLAAVPYEGPADPTGIRRLFSESNSRFLVEVAAAHEEVFTALMKKRAVPFGPVGEVLDVLSIVCHDGEQSVFENLDLMELEKAFRGTLT